MDKLDQILEYCEGDKLMAADEIGISIHTLRQFYRKGETVKKPGPKTLAKIDACYKRLGLEAADTGGLASAINIYNFLNECHDLDDAKRRLAVQILEGGGASIIASSTAT